MARVAADAFGFLTLIQAFGPQLILAIHRALNSAIACSRLPNTRNQKRAVAGSVWATALPGSQSGDKAGEVVHTGRLLIKTLQFHKVGTVPDTRRVKLKRSTNYAV